MQDSIYSQFKLAYKIIKTKPTPSYEGLAGLIGMIVKHSLSSTISNWKKLELFCTVIIEQLVTLKMITIGAHVPRRGEEPLQALRKGSNPLRSTIFNWSHG